MITVSSCSLWMEDQLVWSTGPFRISEECVSRLIYLSLESLIRLRKGYCQFTDASVFQTVISFRSFFCFLLYHSPPRIKSPDIFSFSFFFFLFMWYSPIIYRSPGFQYLSMLREVTWQKRKWDSEAPILQNKAEFLLRSNCPMV